MKSEKEAFLKIFNSIDFEKIKDHPNILIAANFWEEDRYNAARTCYKFMRSIDDMIDDYKAAHREISGSEMIVFEKNVNEWMEMMASAREGSPEQNELQYVLRHFRIPQWAMQDFAKSMIYDIYHDGFPSLQTFLDYAGGASVAPASVFVHLAGLQKEGDVYLDPLFDVREAALPCAIFSYLVHIIRDFQKDQLNNLTYFADDMIARHGLTRSDLNTFAHGGKIPENFRDLVEEYYNLADLYRQKTYTKLKEVSPLVGIRYRLSLEIIFELYVMVFERINIKNGLFTTEEMNPVTAETRERVLKTIMNFQY
jgi:phytoene/squalene synthetase